MVSRPRLWTLALAAGAGTRLASLTGSIPKQFWRMADRPTLLDETLDRLSPAAPPDRTVIVVDAQHRSHVVDLNTDARGRVLYQPGDRGTAAGVLFALTPVLEADPEALVVITPSDHGVGDVNLFHGGLARAVRHADEHDEVVLCGLEPSSAAEDYGWIIASQPLATPGVRRIQSFVEKPAAAVARSLLDRGGLWNTMVTVARARTLFALYRRQLPELSGVFEHALRCSPPEREEHLAAAYRFLPNLDFSRDLMGPATHLSTYVWPRALKWSDLGTPDRFRDWFQTEGGRSPGVRPATGSGRSAAA
jgi:mannose-1-phosphate guanylyltransferase